MPHCIECMLAYVPVSNYFQSQAPSRSFCGIVHCPDCKSYSEDQTRNTTNLHSVSWQLYWLKCNIVIHHIRTSSFSHCRHWALPDFTGSTSHQCFQLYAVVPITPTSTPRISFSKCQSISWEKWWHIFHPTLGEAAFQATPLSKKKNNCRDLVSCCLTCLHFLLFTSGLAPLFCFHQPLSLLVSFAWG